MDRRRFRWFLGNAGFEFWHHHTIWHKNIDNMQLNQSGIKQFLEKMRGWCSEGENMAFGNLEDGFSGATFWMIGMETSFCKVFFYWWSQTFWKSCIFQGGMILLSHLESCNHFVFRGCWRVMCPNTSPSCQGLGVSGCLSFTCFTQDLCWRLTTLEMFDFKVPIVFIGQLGHDLWISPKVMMLKGDWASTSWCLLCCNQFCQQQFLGIGLLTCNFSPVIVIPVGCLKIVDCPQVGYGCISSFWSVTTLSEKPTKKCKYQDHLRYTHQNVHSSEITTKRMYGDHDQT